MHPTHLIFCNEEGVTSPGLQRLRLRDGLLETIVTGTTSCCPTRRTPWGTILFGEEAGGGTASGAWIPNYGERYRSGEAISSAFVESTVNQVVSKRMVKKQQMRWAPKSAQLLLQVRTRVLNDELASVYQRWHPAFDAPGESLAVEDLAA